VRTPPARAEGERGAAVVDFVLVMVVLVPLFLGILQVALVLHVRNTLTAAASEGARYAAAADRPLEAGAARTRQQIAGALAERFAEEVVAVPATVRGAPGVEVRVAADVPALGLWGPAVRLVATGHAIEEVPPDGP
jgi:Flp pilus assembly protein TadG